MRRNEQHGLFFRNEAAAMAPHGNRLEQNIIENNGGAEVRIRGEVRDLVFVDNTIRDTRDGEAGGRSIGIQIEEQVGPIRLENNRIEARVPVDDQRKEGAP